MAKPDIFVRKLQDYLQAQEDLGQSVNDVTILPHDELVQHVLALERRLSEAVHKIKDLETQLDASKHVKAAGVLESSGIDVVLTDEQVKERATKLTDIANREIKKQMKWVPSCKRGTAKWSYSAAVPSEAVLCKMFDLTTNPKGKKWKQKKLAVNDFERAVGSIDARIRCGYLQITGSEVGLRWNEQDRMFTVSGTYGL